MSAAQHTPLRWKASLEGKDYGEKSLFVIGPSYQKPNDERWFQGWPIATIHGYSKSDPSSNEGAIANAEFIVRACNSHYELIAELRACKELIGDLYSDNDIAHYHDKLNERLDGLERVLKIAKAEGK